MSIQTASNTYAYQGLILNTDPSKPISTPAGLLVTRSVETKAGWVGQIIVDKAIVWESEPVTSDTRDHEEKAVRAANERVLARLRKLFG